VWKEKFPDLVCSRDRPCVTCNTFQDAMKKNFSVNPVAYNNARSQHDSHIADAMDIRSWIDLAIAGARLKLTESKTLILVLDHMGIHYIPAFKQSLDEFKSLDGHGVLAVSFSGITNPVREEHDYLIYAEPYGEDSNINCFHFDRFLCAYLKSHTVEKVIIASDTSAKVRYDLVSTIFFFFHPIDSYEVPDI
jgi:hypothetical protein